MSKVYVRGCKAWVVKVDHHRVPSELICCYIGVILCIKHVVKEKIEYSGTNF